MPAEAMTHAAAGRDDLQRYRQVSASLEATQDEVEHLEHTEAFEVFEKQLSLLRKRLLNSPQSLRQVFIDDGMQAIIWEFKRDEISAPFVKTLWNLLLRDDDMSAILLRFVWNVPLKFKRKFIVAIDAHLSDRYPMFKDLSKGWPGQNGIPPYVRTPEERARDFGLVNQGYIGYTNLGYSAREVDLFVWLETLRDKQCEDRACELGVLKPGADKLKGGCPVKIHIPEMIALLGNGKFHQALELIESCNPLPDVTGRVCPQEHQCLACAPGPAGRSRSVSSNGSCPSGKRSAIRCGSPNVGRTTSAPGRRRKSRRSRSSAPAPPASSTPICSRPRVFRSPSSKPSMNWVACYATASRNSGCPTR